MRRTLIASALILNLTLAAAAAGSGEVKAEFRVSDLGDGWVDVDNGLSKPITVRSVVVSYTDGSGASLGSVEVACSKSCQVPPGELGEIGPTTPPSGYRLAKITKVSFDR